MKIAIICSTGGGVLSVLLKHKYFREKIAVIFTDRQCGVIKVAKDYDVPLKMVEASTGEEMSNLLCDNYNINQYDLIISFYTKLFKGKIIEVLKGKFINLHPSILPACPGMKGFEDTVKSGSTFIGATIHYIDSGTDSGSPIIQSATPFKPDESMETNRHYVFVDQCRMLLQVVAWFEDSRLITQNNRTIVKNAKYLPGQYSPNLDLDLAIDFNLKRV